MGNSSTSDKQIFDPDLAPDGVLYVAVYSKTPFKIQLYSYKEDMVNHVKYMNNLTRYTVQLMNLSKVSYENGKEKYYLNECDR